jgi:hypothetical protein
MSEAETDAGGQLSDHSAGEDRGTREGGLRCDFCGEVAPRVRRVALDGDYERLRTRHQVRYACPRCSERKERERRSTAGH